MPQRRSSKKRAVSIDWKISPDAGRSEVDGAPIRLVNFTFRRNGSTAFRFALIAEDAYELREEIGRAYDAANAQ